MMDYADLRWDDLRSAIDEEMGPGFISPAKHRRKATMAQKGMSSRSPPPQAVVRQQHQPLRVLSPNTMSPNARSPTMIHAKPIACIINQQRQVPMLAHNNLAQHHRQKETALAPPAVPFKALGKGCSPEWQVEQQHRRMSRDEGQQQQQHQQQQSKQQQQQQQSKQHQQHQPRVIPIKAVARPPCPAETEQQASRVGDVRGVGLVEESTNVTFVKKPHLHGLMHGGGGGDGGGCGSGGGGGGGGDGGSGIVGGVGGDGAEERMLAPPCRAATKRSVTVGKVKKAPVVVVDRHNSKQGVASVHLQDQAAQDNMVAPLPTIDPPPRSQQQFKLRIIDKPLPFPSSAQPLKDHQGPASAPPEPSLPTHPPASSQQFKLRIIDKPSPQMATVPIPREHHDVDSPPEPSPSPPLPQGQQFKLRIVDAGSQGPPQMQRARPRGGSGGKDKGGRSKTGGGSSSTSSGAGGNTSKETTKTLESSDEANMGCDVFGVNQGGKSPALPQGGKLMQWSPAARRSDSCELAAANFEPPVVRAGSGDVRDAATTERRGGEEGEMGVLERMEREERDRAESNQQRMRRGGQAVPPPRHAPLEDDDAPLKHAPSMDDPAMPSSPAPIAPRILRGGCDNASGLGGFFGRVEADLNRIAPVIGGIAPSWLFGPNGMAAHNDANQLGDVGILVVVEAGHSGNFSLRVCDMEPDSPAEASGIIRLGDTVEAVDGVWFRGDEACEGKFWKAVMGRPGSAVDVRIQNAITSESAVVSLTRQGRDDDRKAKFMARFGRLALLLQGHEATADDHVRLDDILKSLEATNKACPSILVIGPPGHGKSQVVGGAWKAMNPGGTRDAYNGLPLVSGKTWRATGGSSNTLRMVVERMGAEDQPFEISDTVGLASADHARHVLPSMLVRKDPQGLSPKYVDAVVYTQDCGEPVDFELLDQVREACSARDDIPVVVALCKMDRSLQGCCDIHDLVDDLCTSLPRATLFPMCSLDASEAITGHEFACKMCAAELFSHVKALGMRHSLYGKIEANWTQNSQGRFCL